MGDRGLIAIEGVYLYTHWEGSDLPSILKHALERKERWNDAPYLTRIIFCEMVKGDERAATGFGISSTPIGGLNHSMIKVDVENSIVSWEGGYEIPFSEFIKLPDEVVNEKMK